MRNLRMQISQKVDLSAATVSESIMCWKRDIRWSFEPEHVTLQSKSIPTVTMPESVKEQVEKAESINCSNGFSERKMGDVLDAIEERVHQINSALDQLRQSLQTDGEHIPDYATRNLQASQLAFVLDALCHDFETYNEPKRQTSGTCFDLLTQLKERIRQESLLLASLIKQQAETHNPVTSQLLRSISQSFHQIVDQMLFQDCLVLTERLHKKNEPLVLLSDVATVTRFAYRGQHVCRLICQAGCTSALFDLSRKNTDEQVRIAALRAIANVLCLPDAIVEFDQKRKFDTLVAFLWNTKNCEAIRCETAGCLAQLSTHLHSRHKGEYDELVANSQQNLLNSLTNVLPATLRALVNMCQEASGEEIFLVGTACIANLSYLHSEIPILELICHHDSLSPLLRGWRNGRAESLFTKNQLVSIILNLSVRQFGQMYLLKLSSLTGLLIDLLNCQSNQTKNSTEATLAERVVRRCLLVISHLIHDRRFVTSLSQLNGHKVVETLFVRYTIDSSVAKLCREILDHLAKSATVR